MSVTLRQKRVVRRMTGDALRMGSMYWSRTNKQNVYFGWDPETTGQSATFELTPQQAAELYKWLESQLTTKEISEAGFQ